jgi:NAD(P)-dependent dehydrogenase (short-subunit alcohol dehydrogenase family)
MSDLSSLQGKVAVITGSTQGLGETTARIFKARSARGLIITGRSRSRGEAVAASLTGDGCTAHFVQAELDDVDACRRIIAAAEEHFDALHILVNCAALTERGTIWDTSPELFDRMFAINARAPFFLMQEAIKLMERKGIAGHRQHLQRGRLRQRADALALCRVEGRAQHPHQEHRLRGDAPPHPRQHACAGLDGHAGRG